MPYPVPPPSLPPVVSLLPEDPQNMTAVSVAAPTAVATPEFTPAATPSIAADSFSPPAAPPPEVASPPQPSETPEAVGDSFAQSLGTPVEVGVAETHLPPPNESASVLPPLSAPSEASAYQPLSFLYLPDLAREDLQTTLPLPPAASIAAPLSSTRPIASVPEISHPHTGDRLFWVVQQSPATDPSDSDVPMESDSPDAAEPPLEPSGDAPDNAPDPDDVPEGGIPEGDIPNGDVIIIPTEELPEPETPPLETPPPDSPPVPPTGEPVPPGDAPAGGMPPVDTLSTQDVIELNADRQEYDEERQVFRAEGNVELRFRGSILNADRLQVNIPNRIAVADGNATLIRGQQVLRGERIEYNLVQNQGRVFNASGELSIAALSNDTAAAPPSNDVVVGGLTTTQPLSETLNAPFQVLGGTSGLSFGVNTPNQAGVAATPTGQVNRLRYEAEQIEFVGQTWEATNVRITNDPFSPPELELRSRRVQVAPISPTQTEIRASNPRLVFDQGLSLPLLRDRAVIDSRQRNSGLVSFGFDERDRGGFFIERPFDFQINQFTNLSLTPQVLVQRAIDEGGFTDPSSYGLIAKLNIQPSLETSITADAVFTTLNIEDFESTFRGSLRANQLVANHRVSVEYSYRDRLYNGSLGYQDVRSSLGLVVTSPTIVLGDSQITLNYQGGVQFINSEVNQARLATLEGFQELEELLPAADPLTGIRPNTRINLTRYQLSASLNRFFFLWFGTALPATPEEGLRYTANPVLPYVAFTLGGRGTLSAYSNGDFQSVFTGTAGLLAQFGNFSKPFLDYTGISVLYTYNAVGGETPFDFDRVNDIQVLNLGITQQLYGPFRLGISSAFYLESEDLNRDNTADTSFFLEYSRRTYAITLSYSPEREAGALNLRINDFNWIGTPSPFSPLETDSELGTTGI